jgi:ribonuclease HI
LSNNLISLKHRFQNESWPQVFVRFDSKYAVNAITGVHKSFQNKDLISNVRAMYRAISTNPIMGPWVPENENKLIPEGRNGFDVSFTHVKSHSDMKWNDRADFLADLGKRSAQISEYLNKFTPNT